MTHMPRLHGCGRLFTLLTPPWYIHNCLKPQWCEVNKGFRDATQNFREMIEYPCYISLINALCQLLGYQEPLILLQFADFIPYLLSQLGSENAQSAKYKISTRLFLGLFLTLNSMRDNSISIHKVFVEVKGFPSFSFSSSPQQDQSL